MRVDEPAFCGGGSRLRHVGAGWFPPRAGLLLRTHAFRRARPRNRVRDRSSTLSDVLSGHGIGGLDSPSLPYACVTQVSKGSGHAVSSACALEPLQLSPVADHRHQVGAGQTCARVPCLRDEPVHRHALRIFGPAMLGRQLRLIANHEAGSDSVNRSMRDCRPTPCYRVGGRCGERSTSKVISLGAKTRKGGPQKPVPRLVSEGFPGPCPAVHRPSSYQPPDFGPRVYGMYRAGGAVAATTARPESQGRATSSGCSGCSWSQVSSMP
jgi:hypothetical protein